jgi:2-oxoglutarate ferredoxin oxidoreductase subunit beta
LNPIRVALAAGATFVARSIDRDTKHLEETLYRASQHKGISFVEVYAGRGAMLEAIDSATKDRH